MRKNTERKKNLNYDLPVVGAVVQLVWWQWVGWGRVEHEVVGWKLRGLVRVAIARKNTEDY
jgi:hypothetical protein